MKKADNHNIAAAIRATMPSLTVNSYLSEVSFTRPLTLSVIKLCRNSPVSGLTIFRTSLHEIAESISIKDYILLLT